jgi:hypothetical protein
MKIINMWTVHLEYEYLSVFVVYNILFNWQSMDYYNILHDNFISNEN